MDDLGLDAERLAVLARVADRQEILDCLTRLARAIDRSDQALFLSAFHDDALIDAGAFVNTPAKVYEGSSRGHEHGQVSTLHNILNHSCEFDGDTAHCETYFLFTGLNRDGTNWIGGGRYMDRFERRERRWKIAFRYTIMEWSGLIPPVVVPLFDNVPDLRVNGAQARSREDASYLRPLVNRRPVAAPADLEGIGSPHA